MRVGLRDLTAGRRWTHWAPLSKLQKARLRCDEAAGAEVEGPQVVLEVDVEPLAASLAGAVGCRSHQLLPDPLVPGGRGNHDVLDPGVHQPVPDNVDEPDEFVTPTATPDPRRPTRPDRCYEVFVDHASGVLDRRPELEKVLERLRAGDTLVVWRLDRLGRSLRHLIDTVTALDERGVGFRSLRESIDTTTAGGRLVFHLFGALPQFEREIIRDRTVAGLAAARARGRNGGRPSKLTADQVRAARRLYEERVHTVEQIGAMFGVSRTSIYRALRDKAGPAKPAGTGGAAGRRRSTSTAGQQGPS